MLEHYLKILQRAERHAAAAIKEFPGTPGTRSKGGGDYVSALDLASDEAIRAELRSELPDIPLMTEENPDTHKLLSEKRYIVCDPLDGTLICASGCPEWGISIALMQDQRPVCAVMSQPQLGFQFSAIRGQGCFLNGNRVHIPEVQLESYQALVMSIPCSHAAGPGFQHAVSKMSEARLLGMNRSIGCGVAETAELIFGRTHICLGTTPASVWDVAIPQLIVEEAGGCVCGLEGEELVWDSLKKTSILSCNTQQQKKVLDALKS